jgi:hypothetical protein
VVVRPQLGQTAGEPGQFGVDHLGRHGTQGHHGRRDPGGVLGGPEGGDLLGDDDSCGLHVDSTGRMGGGLGQTFQVDDGDTGKLVDGVLDVAG